MRLDDLQDPFVRVLNHLESTLIASHIAAFPVLCWAPTDDVAMVRQEIAEDCLDFSHVPIRDGKGRVRWIACREDLNEKHGLLKNHAMPFKKRHVVDASRPLRETLLLLRDHSVLLLRSPESGQTDGISGIINHADIQKTPVRLLLFAQITEIEARLRNRLNREPWERDPVCAEFMRNAQNQRRDPEGQLPLINYLNLRQLMCLTRTCNIHFFPEKSKDEFIECAKRLTAIRNDISHTNDIGCSAGDNPLDTIAAVNRAFDFVDATLAAVVYLG